MNRGCVWLKVMLVGGLVYAGAVAVGLYGESGACFFGTLFLAGLGWNLVRTPPPTRFESKPS